MPLKNLYVVEDARGRVVKEFYEFEYDAFQLVDEYGDAAKTDKVKAALETNNRATKFKTLWLVVRMSQKTKSKCPTSRSTFCAMTISFASQRILW